MTWRDEALCAQTDPDLWFPERDGDRATNNYAAARAICARCPVRAECLEYALEQHLTDGMWGGLTPYERVALTVRKPAPRRERGTAPHGTEAAYMRHYRAGEKPCDACAAARREYKAILRERRAG